MKSLKSLALVLVPLGILVILIVLNQTGRLPGKGGRAAAAESAGNPTPEPERHKAKSVGRKSLVAKQPKPAAPAPLTRRQSPNGRRLGDRVQFLTEPAKGDPLDIALNYVRTPENRPGYTEDDFKNPKISSRYVSKHNGVTHLYLRQIHEGIEVYGGDIGVNLMPDGSIINLHNAFVTDLASEVNRTDPVLTAQEAIRSAAAFYEIDVTEPLTPLAASEPDPVAKKQLFSPAGISLDPIPVKLKYVPLEEGVTRLAWNTVIRFNDGERWLDLNVDAETGEVLSEANWIACVKCEAHGLEIDENHDCGQEPLGIASETSSVTGTNYNVFPLPLESPSDGSRSVLIDPQNTAASPFGWHDTDGVAGAEFTDTRGNNVNAQEDADNNNTGGARPSGGPFLNFDFPLDLAQAPSTYTSAVTANLFYWNNIIHDVFWHYGFDEPAGNFQENNYGNGGAAGDPVEADSQDGSGTNNANFGTPPDGSNPRMQMYIWTQANPDRDSSLDNGVIIHEYGHGISNRLTGGPANSSALSTNQSRGMGEGWSDFLALALTHQAGDTGAMGRGIGTYVLGQPPTGAGIRPYRYSTDLTVNPQHYGNLNGGGLSVPHGIGSVWCTTLWELYWALVGVHGYNSDIYNGTGGNNIVLQLVIDGMKLQPPNPSFLDARDAILTADQVNNGGANFNTIWAAFAKRGMGFSAYDGGSSSSLAVVAAFDLPDDLNISPGLRTSFVSTGPAGGPFAPSSQTYTLENIGDASLNWTASDNVTWLDLSEPSGTLASSAKTTVNATINANANALGLGVYPAIVTFTNTVSGKTINRNVTLYVNDFATALDSPALTFETSGVSWFSQTTTTHDGVDAAQSGAMGDSQTSSLQTTLTGPGKLTFWWKVSSEANYDFLRFYLNNVEQTGSLARISGEVNWVQKTVSIPLGSHTLRWSYTKDSADIRGSDAAWLDQVVWQPLPLNTVEVSYPNGGETVFLGSTQTISWAANITGNVKIDLFKGGSFHSVLAADEPNDGSFSWLVFAGLPAASDYTVKVSSVDNPGYSDTSDAAFTIMPQPTLADALDTTGLTWLTSGNLPWFSQIATTNDGVDAARSGAITHNQSSSVETTLTGPGQLTFWWKVSSEANWDFLRFYINGVEQSGSLARISGEVNWVQKTVAIPAGSQTVKWSYTKDGSVNSGSDAAWLDQVVFTPTLAPEIAVEQPEGTNLEDGIATISCGSVDVGSPSSPVTFTIKNVGTADLAGLSISKDGAHNADYTVGSLGATSLIPGGSTTFTVTISPSAVGTRTAAIHIASNDSNENPFDISLTGSGIGPGTLEVTPAGGFTSSGSFGGPFSPSALQYNLTNPGNTSIDWTAAKTAEWVTLDATSGTLAAGANTTVTASINAGANSLNIGTYDDTVTFTNTTSGTGDTTRAVSLTVNPITATVNLGNLLQTYDGFPKTVTVTTIPAGLSHSVNYNGSATAPTSLGTYAVVATVTEPNYQGSASSNLVIAHTVTYLGNGNTGGTAPAIQRKFDGVPLTISTNSGNLIRNGFTFVGWNTAADGSGTEYPAGAIYSDNASLTLHAKWAPGSDGTWTQTTAGPFDWGVAANWNGGSVAAGADRTANFTPNITAAQTVNLESARTIGNITFTDSTTTSHDLTISGASVLTLARSGGTPTINVTNRTLTISSEIAGSSGLQKNGAGTLTLSGTNTYSGGTVLGSGKLAITSDTNLGGSAGDISFNGNAELNINATGYVMNAGRTITINGVTATFTSNNNGKTFAGVLEGTGELIAGSTTSFTFSNTANTFSGALSSRTGGATSYGLELASIGDDVGAGLIKLGNTTTAGTLRWIKASGGTTILANRQIVLSGTTGGGTIVALGGTSAENLVITKNLSITGTGNKTLTLGGSNTGVNAFAGDIPNGSSGSVISLTKTEAGTWALGGTNTYSGVTNLSASGTTGRLVFQGAQSLSPNTKLVFAQASSNVQSVRFLDDGAGTINFNRPIEFGGSNTSQVLGIFVGNNNTANQGSGSGTTSGSTIQVGDITHTSTAADTSLWSINVTGANNYRLQTGTITLNNLVTRTAGATTVTELNPTSAAMTVGAITMATGNTGIANDGVPVLRLTGTAAGNTVTGNISNAPDYLTGQPLSIQKTGINDWALNGTANSFTGTITFNTTTTTAGMLSYASAAGTNPITFNQTSSTATLKYTGAAPLTMSGLITAPALTSGAITLDASGVTSADTINYSNTGSLGSAASGNKNLVLTGSNTGNNTLAGLWQNNTGGAATLTKSSGGTWVLTNANSYTGTTAINAGKLFINGDQTAASGNVTISANATLGGTGIIGGATTIAANGKLEFNISTAPGSHNKLELAAGKLLTFSGASVLTITSTSGATTGDYTLVTAPGGITGSAPATLNLPAGWAATVSKVGNDLVLNVTSTGVVTNPYAVWAVGGVAFDADTNGDGVINGLAWLLGATNPSENALNKLPVASRNGSNLRLTFRCLKSTKRGTAQLKVQSSSDLGVSDTWASREAAVPDLDDTVNGVIFDTTDDGDFINVIADIPAAGALIFGRLNAASGP